MNTQKAKNAQRQRRVARTRARIFGTAARPRLAVFRSNRSTYAQLIDDGAAKTLVAASSRELTAVGQKQPPVAQAHELGALIAERAKAKQIAGATFDRRSYKYHGRVRAVAEGARKGGLTI